MLHPITTSVASPATPRPLPARDANRAPDRRTAHAVRRVRACQRRRRAREPEGVRGDWAGVRALSRRVPVGHAGRGVPGSAGSSTACVPAIHPEGQRYLRQAFMHYERLRVEREPRARARARRPCEPRDRPPRADAPAAGDPRGARCRARNEGGSGPACARGAVPVGGALVGDRPGSGAAAIGVVAAGLQRTSSRVAREAITDSLMVLTLPDAGACARNAPGRRLPGGARRARRRGADRAARAVRARCSCARRLRRARLVGSPAADALHRASVPRVPPRRRSFPARPSRRNRWRASAAAGCRTGSSDAQAQSSLRHHAA